MRIGNLQDIKSMFYQFDLPAELDGPGDANEVNGGGAAIATGDGKDVDADKGTQVPTDADPDKAPESDPTEAGQLDPTEEVKFEYNGQVYTAEQMQQALDNQVNKAKWEGDLHQKAADLNVIADRLEASRQNVGHQPEPSETAPTGMLTGEQLKEMILDEPDKAVEAIVNLVSQVTSQQVGNANDAQTVKTHFNSAHPDFDQTMSNPEFVNYVAKLPRASNGQPIYGNANAYLSFKLAEANSRIEDAEKAGFKAGEINATKNIQAAGGIRLIRGDGNLQQAPTAPDVKSMSHEEQVQAATSAIALSRKTNGG